MKTNYLNKFMITILLFFVILPFVNSYSYADDDSNLLSAYFNQQGEAGFIGNVVEYESSSTIGGEGSNKTRSICFTMPADMGNDVFIGSSQSSLLLKGETIVNFDVTFSYGSFSYTFSNPSLNNNNEERRANLYLSDLRVKKEGNTDYVYYGDNKIGTLPEFKAGLKANVIVKSPTSVSYEIPISFWKNKDSGGQFFLLVWLDWIKDKALSILSNILTDLLLAIADALRALINSIFGEEVTLGKVIYNEVNKLNINFWSQEDITSENVANASIGQLLKPLVSFWYGKFQGIVFMIYICILLFVGLKIVLTSTAGNLEKAKELLSSWFLGLLLLVFFPTCMKYTIQINESMVSLVKSQSDSITNNTENIDALDKIHNMASTYKNIPLCIIYIIMLGQLIVLLAVYYKRAFTLAYLIVIFPIVQGYYIYEKVSKRQKLKSPF